jgi:hypothetical protein
VMYGVFARLSSQVRFLAGAEYTSAFKIGSSNE